MIMKNHDLYHHERCRRDEDIIGISLCTNTVIVVIVSIAILVITTTIAKLSNTCLVHQT